MFSSALRFGRTRRLACLHLLGCICFFSRTLLAQGTPETVWQTNNGGLAIAFSNDGQILLSGTRVFAASDGTLLRTFVLPYNGGGINAVALSSDGQYAAIGIQAYNQNLDLFRVADGSLVKGRISAHSNGTTSVAFSPDGQLLATGGRDGAAKLWHLPEMTLVQTLNGGVGYRARIFAVAFSRDGSLLAVGGQGGVQLFQVSDGTLVRTFDGAASTLSLAISPDNQLLSAGSDEIDQEGQCTDCSIKTWRIADGALLQTIDGGNNGVSSIAYSPDQTIIAEGSGDRIFDGVVRFWRVADGALLQFYNQDAPEGSSTYVTQVAYSDDGSLFAFARADGYLAVTHNPFAPCVSSIAPGRATFAARGGSGNVEIKMNGSCGWLARSNASWITLSSNASGNGSGVLRFTIAANSTSRQRSGTITIGSKTFTVTQNSARGAEGR